MVLSRVAVALSLALAACGPASPSTGDRPDAGASAPDAPSSDAPARPTFQRCVGAQFTPEPAGTWRANGAAISRLGAPRHSSQDSLAVPGGRTLVYGKFSYGPLSIDLSSEAIKAWVWDCQSWISLGEGITNSDGRVEITAPTLPVGVYDVRLQVVGDATVTGSTLWILPEGTHVAVTDIDGTLTTSDGELFREILDGSHVPTAYPGAVDLIDAHDDLGHVIVYLTGRPYLLSDITREWLADLGFPLGALHVTDDVIDAIPSDAQVAAYKQAFLDELTATGFVLDLAYGNATTDITAYLGADLPPEQIWIIGDNAGQQGTHAVTDSWAARASEVRAAAAIEQPFQR